MSIGAGTKLPDRDVQTWLRLTSKNLYTRRRQLDSKASIMLSVTAVMTTMSVGSVYPKVQHDMLMVAPLIPTSLCFIVAMFMSVRAMRPHRTGTGRATEQEIMDGTAKLTTFEHFFRMSEDEYEAAVNVMLRDRSFLYDSLTRDIHEGGTMLAHRYRLLEISYMVFMCGMGFGGLTFLMTQYKMFT